MLADEVIAAAGSPDDRFFGGAFTMLATAVKKAQHFDLAPEVMRSAYTISQSPVGPQLRALPLCKLPFDVTWFEWPAGFLGVPSVRTDIYAPVPKRMGALVCCESGTLQRGTITYVWAHDFGVNMAPLSVSFDWRTDAEPLPDLTNKKRWYEKATEAEWHDHEVRFTRVRVSAREDIREDDTRFGIVVNPMMAQCLELAFKAGTAEKLLYAAVKDIEGEAPLLRAAIMLLNSRNLAEHKPRPAPPKLNHARIKSGKHPVVDYTHVQIRLSRALAARAGMASDPRAPTRLHLVRGHFKIRASGIYWWSPHARGHATQGTIATQTRKVMA